MYLSKLVINIRDKGVISNLKDSNYWHKNIMSLFEIGETNSARLDYNILFRLKFDSNFIIYVQSDIEPVFLDKRWLIKERCMIKSLDGLINSFYNGAEINFDLLCVPYYTDSDGKLRSYYSSDDKIKWFREKEFYNGFEIKYISDNKCNDIISNIGGNKNLSFNVSNLSGKLIIKDIEKFKSFYNSGVGRYKAYGVGMLILY